MSSAVRPDPVIVPGEEDHWLGKVRAAAFDVWLLSYRAQAIQRKGEGIRGVARPFARRPVPYDLRKEVAATARTVAWNLGGDFREAVKERDLSGWSADRVQIVLASARIWAEASKDAHGVLFALRRQMRHHGRLQQVRDIDAAVRMGCEAALEKGGREGAQRPPAVLRLRTRLAVGSPLDGTTLGVRPAVRRMTSASVRAIDAYGRGTL